MSCTITATEFKTHFDRGQFSYGSAIPAIRDIDIDSAITEAKAVVNENIYPTEDICKLALVYLSAHFLQLDTGGGEDTNGQPVYNQVSRSVGSISESLHVPEWMKEGDFALYSTTYYGQKWLALTKPYLGGAIYSIQGGTQF